MVEATNRRGGKVRCRVTCRPLLGNDKAIRGVIVVVQELPEQDELLVVDRPVPGRADRSG
jgi:hypothetical protein